MSKAVSRVCFLVFVGLVGFAGFADASEPKSVAVVVYGTGANEMAIAGVAYGHLEQVLGDNGIAVLQKQY